MKEYPDEERVRFGGHLRKPVKTPVGEFSLTQQHFADECDINKIVAKFKTTGVPTHVNKVQPRYGDFDPSVGLAEAAEKVSDAWESFGALPSTVRAMAKNDPIELVRLLADDDAAYALQEAGMDLGLAPREVEEPVVVPTPVPVVETE